MLLYTPLTIVFTALIIEYNHKFRRQLCEAHAVMAYCPIVELEFYITGVMHKLHAQFYVQFTVGIIFTQ